MPESKSPLENAILFLTAILFLSLGLACFAICCYRASLPFEIDPNEAWNAWWSKSLDHLYPSQDALVINNYPPLYFYLLKLGSLADPDPIYTGRTISIFGVIALSVIVFSAIRILGASLPRGFRRYLVFSSLNVAFMGYVGMNDPQLIAMTVMCGGFVWFAQRQEAGKAVEPAVLVMVAARASFKHSIAAIPLSALIWLGMEDPKRALRASVSGVLAAGSGPADLLSLLRQQFYRTAAVFASAELRERLYRPGGPVLSAGSARSHRFVAVFRLEEPFGLENGGSPGVDPRQRHCPAHGRWRRHQRFF